MSDIDRIVEDQISQVEEAVGQETPQAEDYAEEFFWEDGEEFEPHIEEMWRTTTAYTEQYTMKAMGIEPDDHHRKRWARLEQGFRDNPQNWSVADCERCDWVLGGWLTKARANQALSSHTKDKH